MAASFRWHDGTLGPDLALALSYVTARHRPAIGALFEIDAAMADVVRTSTQPMLGAIRLAWWRERLEGLDSGEVPAEPRLAAVAAELLPRGIKGREVAALEGGWLRLFDDFPWGLHTAEAIRARGGQLFGLAASVLGEGTERIETAGGGWALADAARHCSDPASRTLLVEQAHAVTRALKGVQFTSALRPLSMLAAVAMRDAERAEPFEAEGSPRRAAAMLRHRLTGKL